MPPTYPQKHDLDYSKIKKGICFFEFTEEGSCKRQSECWFSHEIPASLRDDTETIENVNKSMKRIHEYRRNRKETQTSTEKQITEITGEYDPFLVLIRQMIQNQAKKEAANVLQHKRT